MSEERTHRIGRAGVKRLVPGDTCVFIQRRDITEFPYIYDKRARALSRYTYIYPAYVYTYIHG